MESSHPQFTVDQQGQVCGMNGCLVDLTQLCGLDMKVFKSEVEDALESNLLRESSNACCIELSKSSSVSKLFIRLEACEISNGTNHTTVKVLGLHAEVVPEQRAEKGVYRNHENLFQPRRIIEEPSRVDFSNYDPHDYSRMISLIEMALRTINHAVYIIGFPQGEHQKCNVRIFEVSRPTTSRLSFHDVEGVNDGEYLSTCTKTRLPIIVNVKDTESILYYPVLDEARENVLGIVKARLDANRARTCSHRRNENVEEKVETPSFHALTRPIRTGRRRQRFYTQVKLPIFRGEYGRTFTMDDVERLNQVLRRSSCLFFFKNYLEVNV